LILHSGDVKKAESHPFHPRRPHIDNSVALPLIKDHPSPRLLKTHVYFSMFLPHNPKMKIIHIMRNPKDVITSYYHYYRVQERLGPFSGSWDEFYQMAVEGYLIWGDWFSHTLEWWNQSRTNRNLLFITYEDLKLHTAATLQQISTFLGKNLTDEAVRVIEKNISFTAMKGKRNGFDLPQEVGDKFFRKGEVSDWKNYFTVAQNEQFDQLIQQRLSDPELLARIRF
jgi:hypothetical protein